MGYTLSLLKLKTDIKSADELTEDLVCRYKNLLEINADLALANIWPKWGDEASDVIWSQIYTAEFSCELTATEGVNGYLLSISTSLDQAINIAKKARIFYVYDHQSNLLYRPNGDLIL